MVIFLESLAGPKEEGDVARYLSGYALDVAIGHSRPRGSDATQVESHLEGRGAGRVGQDDRGRLNGELSCSPECAGDRGRPGVCVAHGSDAGHRENGGRTHSAEPKERHCEDILAT
ncbi:hypothetical protein HD597_003791 [Nonomuraea thailandensis]|uniref:Uncharacterized protein n=1 Tax=Nonomuraea thailandensis TaxID=1188745 RepID=A0A9X2K4N0_9ACTN|nr:hypothetical protein [Nonomuraea thailandensis]MCP2356771.1 hypothetical protein [Nonomuraea thailandensis]